MLQVNPIPLLLTPPSAYTSMSLGELQTLAVQKNDENAKAEIERREGPPDPVLRYRPLPGLDVADYLEEHALLLEQTGVFDKLIYGAAELRLDDGRIDLAGMAHLARAFTQMLTDVATGGGTKRLRPLITGHCRRFAVQVQVGNDWIDLADDANVNLYLDFGQQLDVLFALAGGVLRPLWSRLRSRVGASRSGSAKPSPTPSAES